MSYAAWFEAHANRHKTIVEKLLTRGFDKRRIIDYFDFENMVEAEPDFCPLYAQKRKCHEMEGLNCPVIMCWGWRLSFPQER